MAIQRINCVLPAMYSLNLFYTYGGQSQFPFSSRIPVSPSGHSHGGGVVGGGVVPEVVGGGVVPVYGVVLSAVYGVVALVVPVTVVLSVVPTVVAVPVVSSVVATVVAVPVVSSVVAAVVFSVVVRSVVVRSVVVGGGVVGHPHAG